MAQTLIDEEYERKIQEEETRIRQKGIYLINLMIFIKMLINFLFKI